MFEITVWLNKPRISSVSLRINARSYKNCRCSNFLQIYKILNMPALNYSLVEVKTCGRGIIGDELLIVQFVGKYCLINLLHGVWFIFDLGIAG